MDGNNFAPFPHHKLLAYEVALEFVRLIHATHLSDAVRAASGGVGLPFDTAVPPV